MVEMALSSSALRAANLTMGLLFLAGELRCDLLLVRLLTMSGG